jgi:hypothetical protein
MTIHVLRGVLGWSAIINFGVLLWWFLVFWFAHDSIYRIHGQWFSMPVEHFNAVHYGAMATYKIGVLLFNVAPWIALRIASRT